MPLTQQVLCIRQYFELPRCGLLLLNVVAHLGAHGSSGEQLLVRNTVVRMVRGGVVMRQAIFNKSLLQYLACPLSKEPLRYCEKTNELVSDAIGVAYPIMNGIPCLIPTQGRILDNSKEEQSSTKLSSSNK
ncbi:uncharacterized protein [Physcomitrium patens]|uniref:Protein preY, mitochondrial n=1 Tax=Physcomitrium patens TaxID=3218 RepID=A0A2K1JIA9_PHYPA|nr:uncharacterized protein LOC112291312 isoform X1 [Physcomitrium patens]PNR41290.1 hypothetical protein PHYPA_018693 [Physcomitrium patens]|eukprot:XP_024394275.1 uncharacterized protein LOC112291312 isoform X1 [Physcomitrella patens]